MPFKHIASRIITCLYYYCLGFGWVRWFLHNSNKLGTSSTKSGTIRSSDGNTSAGRGVIEIGEEFITKPTKMVRVKV